MASVDPDLEARIEAVWAHAHQAEEPRAPLPWRYVPLATSDAGTWDVFDRVLERFIPADELLAIPLEKIRDEVIPKLLN